MPIEQIPEMPEALDGIAYRMRLLRDALGMTQDSFSSMTGVGRTSIANYERAIRRPDIDEAIKICAATGVNLQWLYTGEMAAYLPGHIGERIRFLEAHTKKKGTRNSA
jgi:transcriptional regulator with XRE-family HTH domain